MSSNRQNDFSEVLASMDWYPTAVGNEFLTTWGSVKIFEADVPHLNFCRVQAAWLDSDMDDIRIRRNSVYAIARSVISKKDVPDEDLIRIWSLIGVESCSAEIADAICTLYHEPPVRVFNEDGDINEGFGDLYTEFDVNLAMQDAYRAALFTNIVLLMPDVEKGTIRVLTPDYFRLVGEDDKPKELWLIKGDGGFTETRFEVWTNEERRLCDSKGRVLSSEPNPYGRFPGTLLKLNRSNDLYGAGITEAAEINAWSNLIGFFSTRIALYQSYSVGVVTNMQIAPGTSLGPGHLLSGENAQGEAHTAPSFEFVTPSGKFAELEDYYMKRLRAFKRKHGLPAFQTEESSGTPPTGIALMVLERVLNNKRKQHIKALARGERDFAELLAIMTNMRLGRQLIVDDSFRVEWAKPESFTDPSAELEFDKNKASIGLLPPSVLAQKYLNLPLGTSDEDAMKAIQANKAFFAGIGQSTIGMQ